MDTRVYVIGPKGFNKCTESEFDNAIKTIQGFLRDADLDEVIEIEVKEMDVDEYRQLPEYTGP